MDRGLSDPEAQTFQTSTTRLSADFVILKVFQPPATPMFRGTLPKQQNKKSCTCFQRPEGRTVSAQDLKPEDCQKPFTKVGGAGRAGPPPPPVQKKKKKDNETRVSNASKKIQTGICITLSTSLKMVERLKGRSALLKDPGSIPSPLHGS